MGAIFTFSTSSCNDWLAVDMEDGVMENTLFKTNDGYLASLNGVYSKMNETYGSVLTMGQIDAMAQYYSIAQNSQHSWYSFATYNYTQSEFETTSSSLWTNIYGLIANLNTLLEHCDKPGSSLKSSYYPYIKGEALALRAFFHFDLLRLYGPIYNSETQNILTIPYQNTTSKEVQPLLSAQKIMENVISDLNQAADLLKNDPVRTEGVMNSDSPDPNVNNDLRYRQYRLNYYAVQALLARAYLWIGDQPKAYEIATSIIKENNENKVFPWTAKSAVLDNSIPDRLFSTEVMFALYNLKRVDSYNSLFKNTASANSCLIFPGSELDADDSKLTTFYSDKDDLRRSSNMWSSEEMEETSSSGDHVSIKGLCFAKYADLSTSNSAVFRYMIPLIRMSEIYLIAAECSSDKTEKIDYINMIRRERNCVDIVLSEQNTDDDIQSYINKEFAKEVIGEGQLFFFYKRHAMTIIPSGTSATEEYQMNLNNYVLPLPKVEKDKRLTD